jgi:SAM-dependent methyltransferase
MKYYPPRYLFRRYELLRALKPGQNFLEIGPGNMELAQELLDFFQQGLLIDFSPSAKMVFQNLPPTTRQRLELQIADFREVSLPTTFDCIVACEVLEHVEDESAFLGRIYDCLRPGGQVILSVPARMKFWSKHDELVGHLRRYEQASAQKLLSDHHFVNVGIIAYGFPFINILRWPRIVWANRKWQNMQSKTAAEKTAWSGIQQTAGMPGWAGLICNPYTVYPFARLAALFNHYDWSEGYLIVANKA